MDDPSRHEQSRFPGVRLTNRMLDQLPDEYHALEFSTELDEETIRKLVPDEEPFVYTQPGIIYGPSGKEPEIVLWSLSLN